MEINVQPGKYVVAVSGGVDSMVLLDLLRRHPGVEVIVAHIDHGIRPDSADDRKLVEAVARTHGLPFVYEEARLGKAASEAVARQARYDFLRRVKHDVGAQAIVTAHHQDDVLETAVINLLRGTGRKGLSSLQSTAEIKRPLLNLSKAQIRTYAETQQLDWREDSTNQDESYLRNYVRRRLLPRLSTADKHRLLEILHAAADTNTQLDRELAELFSLSAATLSRTEFIRLSHVEAKEVMAAWLRANNLRDFDSPMLERLVVVAKTARPGKRADIAHRAVMHVTKTDLALEYIER